LGSVIFGNNQMFNWSKSGN